MIYTVTTTLPPEHGGRTKSLLGRVKMLDTELEIPTTILTTNYNANYPDIYQLFLEQDKVTSNIEYGNIYDWLSNYKLLTTPRSKFRKKDKYFEASKDIEGLTYKESKNGQVIRYYENERYVLYRKFYDDSKVLEFEDFMSPVSKKKIQRWQYNKYGILHRKIYYSHDLNKKILEEFFDIEGHIYCKKHFSNNENNDLIYIQTYKNNKPNRTFATEKQLFQFYFESVFKDDDIVFCDARLLDVPLIKQTNKTKNVLVFHSSHLSGENIKGSYKFALNNSDKISKYIVLTHKQKDDIQNAISINSEKFAVIPHFIKSEERSLLPNKENRFVFIGRLSPEKQLDHIIKAYKKFLDYGYTTNLAIYGRNEANQRERLESMIKDFDITDKVSINEFTEQPKNEFQKSKASILTSKFEGFGLSVMESIEMGCPVISYDIRYGPSEIINHGENGYLVEANNIDSLTSCMKEVIDSPLENVKTKPELKYEQAINNFKNMFNTLN